MPWWLYPEVTAPTSAAAGLCQCKQAENQAQRTYFSSCCRQWAKFCPMDPISLPLKSMERLPFHCNGATARETSADVSSCKFGSSGARWGPVIESMNIFVKVENFSSIPVPKYHPPTSAMGLNKITRSVSTLGVVKIWIQIQISQHTYYVGPTLAKNSSWNPGVLQNFRTVKIFKLFNRVLPPAPKMGEHILGIFKNPEARSLAHVNQCNSVTFIGDMLILH